MKSPNAGPSWIPQNEAQKEWNKSRCLTDNRSAFPKTDKRHQVHIKNLKCIPIMIQMEKITLTELHY